MRKHMIRIRIKTLCLATIRSRIDKQAGTYLYVPVWGVLLRRSFGRSSSSARYVTHENQSLAFTRSGFESITTACACHFLFAIFEINKSAKKFLPHKRFPGIKYEITSIVCRH